MLEVQTDGAAAERFQIIFFIRQCENRTHGCGFFMRAVQKLKFWTAFFYLPDSAAARHASSWAWMRRGASSKIAFCASFVFGAS